MYRGTLDVAIKKMDTSNMQQVQCDAISFGGDVVLKSFNMVSRGDGSILDQIYEKQMHFLGSLILEFEILKSLKKICLSRL